MSPVRFLEKTTLPAPTKATLIMACSQLPHVLPAAAAPAESPEAPEAGDVGRVGGAVGVVLQHLAGAIDVFVARVFAQPAADLPAHRPVEERDVAAGRAEFVRFGAALVAVEVPAAADLLVRDDR